MAPAADDDWHLERQNVDPSLFDKGTVGPYRLGQTVRKTAFGEVVVALHPHMPSVVELDMLDDLAGSPLVGPEAPLMADLSAASEVQHRHVGKMIGSGFADGVPYVVREHRLGRTLREIVERGKVLGRDSAVGVLYSVTSAVAFLAEQGASKGAVSMGGFDDRDVFLGFDGSILLVGLGLKRARGGGEDPAAADLISTFELARKIDDNTPEARLSSTIAGASSLAALAKALQKRRADACAHRVKNAARLVREAFAEAVIEERSRFGLGVMH